MPLAVRPRAGRAPGEGRGAAGFANDERWKVEVVAGPNDDWIDGEGHARFLSADWKLSAKSDRTGFRLDGPEWTFTEKATHKAPEHGSLPSNIIDQGYPLGAINLAGQTPIILVNDGPSMGGFINPYTVPQAAFWKLGQSKPGETYRFKAVSVAEAQAMARRLGALCTELPSDHLTIGEEPMTIEIRTLTAGNVWKVLVKPGDTVPGRCAVHHGGHEDGGAARGASRRHRRRRPCGGGRRGRCRPDCRGDRLTGPNRDGVGRVDWWNAPQGSPPWICW